jgi:hypothetical protein
VVGDVPQQPPHDLAGPGLRQLRHDHDLPRLGDRADLDGDVVAQRLHQLLAGARLRGGVAAQDDEGDDALPGGRVGGADHGRLGHGRVRDQRRFHLGRGDPVPGHVHHVVDPAE